MLTSFEMKNPIDLSIDPSRLTNANDLQLSPTNQFSRITGIKAANGAATADFSNFCEDDSKIIDLLINNPDDPSSSTA